LINRINDNNATMFVYEVSDPSSYGVALLMTQIIF